jgi:hypothetical protein
MTISSKDNSIDWKYTLISGIAVVLSWTLHEFAHWFTGSYLGYNMAMTLNKSFPLNEKYATIADYQIISAAGPLSTLTQAIVIFMVMKHSKIKWLYSFLFTCFYMRFFAAIISFLNPNDEARVSKFLGIGTFTLPIIMVAFLFFFVYKISKQYKFGYRFIAINLGLVILFSSIIILADQFFFIRLL